MPHIISLSIRSFAEFLLRSGSIDSRFTGLDRGPEGARIHRFLQKQSGADYKAEVPLSLEVTKGDFTYKLSGRADGIITAGGKVTVDEIKTVTVELDSLDENSHPAHWAQASIYAHIICSMRQIDRISVQLSYCHADTLEVRRFVRCFTASELATLVDDLLTRYQKWSQLTVAWKQKRDAGLRKLAFPFPEYREGQRRLAAASYTAFKNGEKLFCCAPTGIGKTISTLFPAMKALGEGYGERIFYLTAKTITRKSAEDAATLLNCGAFFRSLTLSAKDKVCILDERACYPEQCPRADGYYDRINDALFDLLQNETEFGREKIEAAAQKYLLCPYELSLDLALWCDLVICDYNYLFDPVVHLQRFFENKNGDHIFLIDEAHNLVDRSREMYSATIEKSKFYDFKKALPKSYRGLHNSLQKINSFFIDYRHLCEENDAHSLTIKERPKDLEAPVAGFIRAAEEFFDAHKGSEYEKDLLSLYFEACFFRRIYECYEENYITLVYSGGNNVSIKLYCLDSSRYLKESLDLGRGSVLFSATLQPLEYYREILGGDADSGLLTLQSPFKRGNLGLFVADNISTKYTDRELSLSEVCSLIYKMAVSKKGNYIAYFPSYSYMINAWELFTQKYENIETVIQKNNMSEKEREDFLTNFGSDNNSAMLAFCVMGGIFAEGIDLTGNRLIGAAIVGVGLPQIGPVPNAIRAYYDELYETGFEYAYQFPGMNKVLQAAGRVIRTAEDKGIVLLIDKRFGTRRYIELFPPHWQGFKKI